MHRRKKFPRIKSVFSTFYYCVPNFRALGLIMNDFFLLVGPLNRRYLDDTFVIFEEESQVMCFLEFINSLATR